MKLGNSDIKEIYITTEDNELIFSIGEEETGIMKKGYKAFIINSNNEKIDLIDKRGE